MAFKMNFSGFGMGTNRYVNPNDPSSNSMMPKKKNASTYSKSYEQAYKDRDMKVYGKLTQEEYTKEAKRQNAEFKKTGKWDYKNAPKVTEENKNKRTSTRTVDTATDTTTTTNKDRGVMGNKTTTVTTDKATGNVTTQKDKNNKSKSETRYKNNKFLESSKNKKNKNKTKVRNEDGSITKTRTNKKGETISKTRGKGKMFFKKDK